MTYVKIGSFLPTVLVIIYQRNEPLILLFKNQEYSILVVCTFLTLYAKKEA
jgi:hypothetical protein